MAHLLGSGCGQEASTSRLGASFLAARAVWVSSGLQTRSAAAAALANVLRRENGFTQFMGCPLERGLAPLVFYAKRWATGAVNLWCELEMSQWNKWPELRVGAIYKDTAQRQRSEE